MNVYPLHVDEAQRIILETVSPLPINRVPLAESVGYVLAEDIIADLDIPLFDRSMMDGFALRYEDVLQAAPAAPVGLQVVEEVPAGKPPEKEIGAGQTTRIMTGAMIPRGANAVCRFEATEHQFKQGIKTVYVMNPVNRGENIAFQGEDIRKGSSVLKKGILIGPAEVAVLATFGISRVPVYRKPVVGILSSGTELIDVHEQLQPGKIRNSNSYMVGAMVHQAGGIPKLLKPVADDTDAITEEIAAILPEIDLLVTTGGVSVGDYDLMPNVYEKLGATAIFWKVLLRPGSPVRYALRGSQPFIGVSGNPAASFVNSQLFVLPALRKMAGQSLTFPGYIKAKMINGSVKTPAKQTRFLRATAYLHESTLKVSMAEGQSSGMIGSFVGANCLIRLNGGETLFEGADVDILLYGEVSS